MEQREYFAMDLLQGLSYHNQDSSVYNSYGSLFQWVKYF